MVKIKSRKIEGVIDEIIDQYTYADRSERPWIIGFSGGKDSTVLLTLVWIALQRIREELPFPFQLKRKVYVVCNDTMVENPVLADYVQEVLKKIDEEARNQDLPIFVKRTTPQLEETFWTNVIGKGYPVPNNSFRWCTDKLKIRPTSNFLLEQIDEMGEAIVLLGTRYDESLTRERSIRRHEVAGRRLSKHKTSANTYTYAPIKELMVEEVWYVINTVASPWGYDNNILFQIYADASADDYECPTVITDKKHTSCGQSRFGCWTCTVVKNDKSMTALVNNGRNWMQPLMDFRNKLVENRNLPENRMDRRRNGQLAKNKDDENNGTYNINYRYQILKDLLTVQKQVQQERPDVNLINNQELIAIQVLWNRDGYFDHTVGEVYKAIYNKDISTNNIKTLDYTEKRIIREVCQDDVEYYNLIDNLISLQETKTLLISKYGLHNDIERRIEKFATGTNL
ncbi:DNA phosphorothioation system sulfurtransferase DndC [Chryseobacterium salipaludis]|uniref:DNA phosphorothioation system sulfurtransferase DndC n=1 Tax=Chryseobacterium TaxID=59732 RepID=UPI001FF18ACB|nr:MULTISPECIES: DNA phosphorothioation system sulfurtransferase DndC [Chryseobacterium]MCJ8498351.1 DNA phosphorothioation system sulfurtransferase DndC [Chryseobacterium salipaludis]MCX3297404.1 DNA phosphorothioation system sulfurtransferase DndC [Planobacterium sp. JC490]